MVNIYSNTTYMVVIESAISAQNMSTKVFNCLSEYAINLSSVSSSKAIMPAS